VSTFKTGKKTPKDREPDQETQCSNIDREKGKGGRTVRGRAPSRLREWLLLSGGGKRKPGLVKQGKKAAQQDLSLREREGNPVFPLD